MTSAPHTVEPAGAGGAASVDRSLQRIAWLLLFVAGTLGVASALHLSGGAHGTPPFDADHAGIAEAVIGAVLIACGLVMLRVPARARAAGLLGTVFAVAGFGVGLSFTVRGGHAPDIAYHVALLPVLLATFVVLVRHKPHAQPDVHPSVTAAGAA